jgi:hypothetical protein
VTEQQEKAMLALLERIATAVEQTAKDTHDLRDRVVGAIDRRGEFERTLSRFPKLPDR